MLKYIQIISIFKRSNLAWPEKHYTPKHGSWLDIAEIGINIMTRECLNRRIPDIEVLKQELKAWNDDYDRNPSPVN